MFNVKDKKATSWLVTLAQSTGYNYVFKYNLCPNNILATYSLHIRISVPLTLPLITAKDLKR